MKDIYKLVLLFIALGATGCSEDESNPSFAMSAKINGVSYKANSPSNNNLFSVDNLFDYFPNDEFILLQARDQRLWGPEINLWLKKSDLVPGAYNIGQETFSTPPSHFIDLIDNSNEIEEFTKSGIIEITEVNTSDKIVKGKFQFMTVQLLDNASAPVDYAVTDGTFKYKYE